MPSWAWLLVAAGVLAPRRDRTSMRLRAIQAHTAPGAPGARAGWADVCWKRLAAWIRGPQRRTTIGAIILVALLAATISSGLPLVGLSAGLVVAVVASTVGQALDGRSVRARRRQLRSALRMLRAELVAGAREPEALLAASGTETASSAAGIGDRFRRAAVVAGAGGDVAAVFASTGRTGAVERSVSRSVDQDFAPLAAAWHVRSRCGAALADLVGKAENDLMAADERWREADAAMAGPRSSAGLLAGLPLVGLGLGSAMGAHPVGWLLGTTPGAILLLLGVTFDAIGLMWMQRLVRSGFSESR